MERAFFGRKETANLNRLIKLKLGEAQGFHQVGQLLPVQDICRSTIPQGTIIRHPTTERFKEQWLRFGSLSALNEIRVVLGTRSKLRFS